MAGTMMMGEDEVEVFADASSLADEAPPDGAAPGKASPESNVAKGSWRARVAGLPLRSLGRLGSAIGSAVSEDEADGFAASGIAAVFAVSEGLERVGAPAAVEEGDAEGGAAFCSSFLSSFVCSLSLSLALSLSGSFLG